jgi:hypothetical protein
MSSSDPQRSYTSSEWSPRNLLFSRDKNGAQPSCSSAASGLQRWRTIRFVVEHLALGKQALKHRGIENGLECSEQLGGSAL